MSNCREKRWRSLLAAIAEGDDHALTTFYEETAGLIFRVTYRILGNKHDAEEVTLNVYRYVWHSAATYDRGRGNVLSWILLLARTRALDYLRARTRLTQRAEPLLWPDSLPAPGDPEQRLALDQLQRQVRRALDELTPDQRRAIELVYFDGVTHMEAAALLAVPLGTLKGRVRAALSRLRLAIGGRA